MPLPENIAGLSPMMRQYIEIKSKHQDEILFYRLGDFYEMFFDDAVTASRELELVLTGRDCGLPERAPMCGVPHHSSESYVARLIKKGYKVAICEQVEDPAMAKGIVRRDVVRVVTPGTVTDSSMLSEESNNYIACVEIGGKNFGLCFADISTGTVFVTEGKLDIETIVNELARFSPTEIVMNEAAYNEKMLSSFISKLSDSVFEQLYEGYFQLETAKDYILKQFPLEQTALLQQMPKGDGVKALGALVKYVGETQHSGVERLVNINVYRCAEYLSISAESRRNLELTETMRGKDRRGSLLWTIDKTVSSMGKRLLRSWLEKPLTDVGEINRRLDAVEELFNNTIELGELRDALSKVYDIERLMTRVLYRSATPRDFVALKETAKQLRLIKSKGELFSSALLQGCFGSIDTLDDIEKIIGVTIADEPPALLKDGGYIKDGFSAEVDELRELLHNSRNVLSRMEQKLKETTGIKNLKIGYNKVFGYYIEVSRSNTEHVPEHFIRKQTLTNGERYITEELKDLENRILGANERLNVLERELFEGLREEIERNLKRIQRSADAVSALDVLCGFTALGLENNYCRPVVDDSGVIDIKNGRHPVVEMVNKNELFVPNDTYLDQKDNLVNIITGPNMAGKSTYMRQTALIVILAQMGCFVPAREAHVGIVDAVFTRIGASDDLFSGDSTFMIEMKEVAYIFNKATKRSLIILDEVGRGTSTYDGMSIARAVVEYIVDKSGPRAKTMFATHYHELTVMDQEYGCIKNYNIAAKKKGDDIVFLRRIVHGPADDSYGIEVAKLAGIPDAVVECAKRALSETENRQGYRRIQKSDIDDGANYAAVIERLKLLNIEALTPMEAMYTLHELASAVKSEEEK